MYLRLNDVRMHYKGNNMGVALAPECWLTLKRNSGSQAPERWLNLIQNTQYKAEIFKVAEFI